MKVVVDTHALVWWTLQPSRLSTAARKAFTRADELGVPAIVFWEVSVLVRKRKLELDLPILEWAHSVMSLPRVQELPLTAEIAMRADQLALHADPADRFIVATALEWRATLVTKDAALRRTSLVPTIW